jgi:hypothetical protein
MWHAWERGETCTKFWWESTKELDHSEDRGVDGIEWMLGRLAGTLKQCLVGSFFLPCCACFRRPLDSCKRIVLGVMSRDCYKNWTVTATFQCGAEL